MRTIETKATIAPDGTLTAQVPADIPPGEHAVVVVIESEPIKNEERPSLDFPVHCGVSWPEDLSLRREDMYDEWGR
ncbi:MAG: hypothetical protein ABIH23_06010 [bacterium]